jgi:hypothetical protein
MDRFWTGFEKRAAGGLETAAELSGLGLLAVPSIQKLRDKPVNESTAAKMEVGGLGILAAPYLHNVAKSGLNKLKKPKSVLGKIFKI